MTAREKALREAVDEARRFISRAQEALADTRPEAWPSMERAAAKRASLDLTRALAKWRRTP